MRLLRLLPLTGLLATSVAGLAVPVSQGSELESSAWSSKRQPGALADADQSDGPSCNLTSSHLMTRNLDRGIWSQSDVPYLDAQSKHNANMKNLMELHALVSRKLGKKPRAVQGGLMYILRGKASRTTSDLDMVVQTHMSTLMSLFQNDNRFFFPSWKPTNVLRLYVDLDANPRCPRWMELDLIISGTLSTPKDLKKFSDPIEHEGQTVYLMDPGVSFVSKVQAVMSRKDKWYSDMGDLKFLLKTFPKRIYEVHSSIPFQTRAQLVEELERQGSSLVETAQSALQVGRRQHHGGHW